MSGEGVEYEIALAKFPPVLTRKHRRAAWRAVRRNTYCTHGKEVGEDSVAGLHRDRGAMWRQLWPLMTRAAAQIAEKRRAELLAASEVSKSNRSRAASKA